MASKLPTSLEEIEQVALETDVLVIGGGNSGCFAAIEAKKLNPKLRVTIMEKAHIDRSGCLAAGMDAFNTYIKKGRTIEEFVRWSRSQAGGLIREGGTIVLCTASSEGYGFHSLHGPSMRLSNTRSPRQLFGDRQLVIFCPNIIRRDLPAEAQADEGLILCRTWGEVAGVLERRHGAGARVAVFPCSAMQLAEE